MNKLIKSTLILTFFLLIFFPFVTFAQNSLIPCGDLANGQHECGYADLLQLVNNVIDWIIMISVPIAAGVFAWAGIKYMMTGVSDQKAAAKAMLQKVFWGFVIILSAWIIVTTILNALLSTESGVRGSVPVEGVNR